MDSAELSPLQLANQSGRGWVSIWNRRVDANAEFARALSTRRVGSVTAIDVIRNCPSRNRDFELFGGILVPTKTVGQYLVHYLDVCHGVRLPTAVIRCILNYYSGHGGAGAV